MHQLHITNPKEKGVFEKGEKLPSELKKGVFSQSEDEMELDDFEKKHPFGKNTQKIIDYKKQCLNLYIEALKKYGDQFTTFNDKDLSYTCLSEDINKILFPMQYLNQIIKDYPVLFSYYDNKDDRRLLYLHKYFINISQYINCLDNEASEEQIIKKREALFYLELILKHEGFDVHRQKGSVKTDQRQKYLADVKERNLKRSPSFKTFYDGAKFNVGNIEFINQFLNTIKPEIDKLERKIPNFNISRQLRDNFFNLYAAFVTYCYYFNKNEIIKSDPDFEENILFDLNKLSLKIIPSYSEAGLEDIIYYTDIIRAFVLERQKYLNEKGSVFGNLNNPDNALLTLLKEDVNEKNNDIAEDFDTIFELFKSYSFLYSDVIKGKKEEQVSHIKKWQDVQINFHKLFSLSDSMYSLVKDLSLYEYNRIINSDESDESELSSEEKKIKRTIKSILSNKKAACEFIVSFLPNEITWNFIRSQCDYPLKTIFSLSPENVIPENQRMLKQGSDKKINELYNQIMVSIASNAVNPIFDHIPCVEDIKDINETQFKDKTFLNVLSSLIRSNQYGPKFIMNMMRENVDKTVTVKLNQIKLDDKGEIISTEPRYVILKKQGFYKDVYSALWVEILEQAYENSREQLDLLGEKMKVPSCKEDEIKRRFAALTGTLNMEKIKIYD